MSDRPADRAPAGLTGGPGPGRFGLTSVRVVDPDAGTATPPIGVLVADGLVAWLGTDPLPRDLPVLADGGWLAPGMVDGHVHLAWDGGPDPVAAYRSAAPGAWLEVARRNAAAALRAGVTTLRDLGGPAGLAGALATRPDGEPPPDVLASGPPITRPGGHLALFGGEVAGPAAARAAVERAVAGGARAVKLVLSGGGLSPGSDPRRAELPADDARAAVAAAHRAGLRVAAHCHARAAMELALAVGVDSVEHASCLGEDGRATFDACLARRLADAGVAVTPTAAGALRTAARYRADGRAPSHDPGAVARLEARAAFVPRWAEAGVPLLAGTDAGVTDTPFDALHDELAAWVATGVEPAVALRAATSGAARILGLADRGRVAPGLRADLVLVGDDPTRDLPALRAPRLVVAAGRPVSPGGPRSGPPP